MKTAIENEDSFYSLALFYEKRYDDELKDIGNKPIYDFNRDTNFDNMDLNKNSLGRKQIKLLRE
jgi:hypothetical protein